jgi:hypothetical protein
VITIRVVCCSVLKTEVSQILAQEYPHIECIFIDSMFHMKPLQLEKEIENCLENTDIPTLLIYGECEPSVYNIDKRHPCERTLARNCTELLAGKTLSSYLEKELAFVLLPEWTERWKEVFEKELGFSNQELAQTFIHEFRKRFVYLDSGLQPVPEKALNDIRAFFDMEVQVIHVGNTFLKKSIDDALSRLLRRFS